MIHRYHASPFNNGTQIEKTEDRLMPIPEPEDPGLPLSLYKFLGGPFDGREYYVLQGEKRTLIPWADGVTCLWHDYVLEDGVFRYQGPFTQEEAQKEYEDYGYHSAGQDGTRGE